MFKYKRLITILQEEQEKNERMREENKQIRADVDYLAMMCDVELEEVGDE